MPPECLFSGAGEPSREAYKALVGIAGETGSNENYILSPSSRRELIVLDTCAINGNADHILTASRVSMEDLCPFKSCMEWRIHPDVASTIRVEQHWTKCISPDVVESEIQAISVSALPEEGTLCVQ